jgi:hypothetical protein
MVSNAKEVRRCLGMSERCRGCQREPFAAVEAGTSSGINGDPVAVLFVYGVFGTSLVENRAEVGD